MEPTKFTLLVNELLEPTLKSHIQRRSKYPYLWTNNPHETSIALRPKARACDDCGDTVIGRVIFIEKKSIGNKNEYWRKQCGECGKKDRLHNGLKDV